MNACPHCRRHPHPCAACTGAVGATWLTPALRAALIARLRRNRDPEIGRSLRLNARLDREWGART